MSPSYASLVALGDSQTEGLNDHDAAGSPVGWADRFAAHLAATTSPGLRYANLAVRACRAEHVRSVQLPAALALDPELATVAVGMNDVLRHDFDLRATVADIETTVAALRAHGCDVLTMTFPDIGLMIPAMRWLRPREARLNAAILEIAARYDVPVLDLFPLPMCGDPRMWSHDRIHGSTDGHRRIAAGMAELIGLPGSDPSWRALPARRRGLPLRDVARDAWWAGTFLAPWLWRQLSGDGSVNVAKRPTLEPVAAGPG